MAHDVIKKSQSFINVHVSQISIFLCVNDFSMEVNNLGTPIGIASGFFF